jgi:hypothetical protein
MINTAPACIYKLAAGAAPPGGRRARSSSSSSSWAAAAVPRSLGPQPGGQVAVAVLQCRRGCCAGPALQLPRGHGGPTFIVPGTSRPSNCRQWSPRSGRAHRRPRRPVAPYRRRPTTRTCTHRMQYNCIRASIVGAPMQQHACIRSRLLDTRRSLHAYGCSYYSRTEHGATHAACIYGAGGACNTVQLY